MNSPHVPISWGELVDKITNLKITLKNSPQKMRSRILNGFFNNSNPYFFNAVPIRVTRNSLQ